MKKQFYSKLLFLFALLLTVSTSVWAETESTILTLDFSSAAAASGSDGLTTETAATLLNSAAGLESGITCSAINTVYDGKGQGGDGIPQKCLKVGKSKGPGSITFTIPSSYDEVSKVEITGYGWKNTSSISINGGTAQTYSTAATEATKTFELSTASREIAIAVTTSAVCITEIKLIKVESSGTPTCATPTFSPEAGIYAETQNVTISTTTSGATIYYTTDGTDPTTSSNVYKSAIAVNETTTIKAIATASGYDNSSVASATYTILEHAGTDVDPYTVADARAAIDAVGTVEGVYATGIVSEIVTAFNSQYGNISYNISVDGKTTSDQLQAYRGKSYNGDNFTSEDDIQVGDEVVIYGNLKKHNSTYEFDANNKLVSLVRPAAPVVASVTAEPAELDVDAAEHDGTIEVTYSNITDVNAEIMMVEANGETEASYGWILAEFDTNNNISYIIGKNTGAARTAYLKVYALDDNGEDVYSNLITINQAKALEQFTVTYYVAGEKFTTTRQEGAALNLTAPDALGGYQFAGWSTANNATTPDFVENTAAVNSNLTLYAIFVKEVGETVYNKVIATDDITDGKYLIVYEDGNVAFNGSLETLDASENTIDVEILENKIEGSKTVDAATFTINAAAGTIQSASGLYIGNTSDSNALAESAETAYTNTLSIDEEGNADIISSGGAHLRYNFASNQLRFRYYKTASYTGQKAIQLYKQNQIAPATYTLNEPEATITAAANATWVAPAKVKIKNDDVKVYTVTYDDAVGCTRKHEVLDKVVPANGVVLLTSETAITTTKTVTLEKTTDEADDYNELVNDHKNDLLGSDGTIRGAGNIFCLAVGEKGLGFYPVSKTICVPAGKAYLKIGEDEPVEDTPSYIWFNGDTTAIDSLTTDTAAGNESGEIYSLTGQRVGKNYRGIVIMNGRKVLKK